MASPRLLVSTDLTAFQPLAWEDRTVHASYERLLELLRRKGPRFSVSLFAQPVVGPHTIAWCGEGHGDARPLNSLSAPLRGKAEARLRRQLQPLAPLLDDAELGPLLRRTLVLPGPESILVLDDQVLLAGWGLAPRDIAADDAALAEQVRHLLGPYLPELAMIGEGFLHGASVAATPPAIPRMPMPALPPLPPLTQDAGRRPAAWLLPGLAVMALLLLGLGFWMAWIHPQAEMAIDARRSTLDQPWPASPNWAQGRMRPCPGEAGACRHAGGAPAAHSLAILS